MHSFRVALTLALTLFFLPGRTWAAIGDPAVEGAAGLVPSVISVNTFSGAASTSYGFHVPPGRSGIAPDLRIVYSSGAGYATPIGKGWDFIRVRLRPAIWKEGVAKRPRPLFS